jgi:hypothetical protein
MIRQSINLPVVGKYLFVLHRNTELINVQYHIKTRLLRYIIFIQRYTY